MGNSFIENVNSIAAKLNEIITANNLFNTDSLAALEELKNLNITLIVEDFKKGNYLGNRKIDIDLSLNNTSTTSVPTYQRALIVLVDGVQLDMPFLNGSGGILELSSHADIKNFIVNHDLFSQVVDTEVVTIEAFGETPAMIRIRDADGKASNIERIELFVFSGTVVENKVSYFWAKTTSALETLANRVGDIIQLGNDIDSIINLSQRIEELISLQEQIPKIINVHDNLLSIVNTSNNMEAIVANNTYKNQFMAIYNKLSNLTEIHTNLAFITSSLQNAETAAIKAQEASISANSANQNAGVASNKATLATEKAQLAVDTLASIRGITVQASQLLSTQTAFVEYNSITNKFTFGIPQGTKGDRGEAFKVNSIGTFANRALYNSELENFSYLATDIVVDGSTIPHIYFKKSAIIGDWTTGIPFGRGEKGDDGDIGVSITNIQRVSGNGLSGSDDIYEISLSNGTSHEFTVHNGIDSDINSSDLSALESVFNEVLATKVNISDIKNNLVSIDPDKPLSALQGKILKDLIDNINTLISSDDTTLDQMQEVVNFIKQNKDDLQNLDLSNIAETITLKHFTALLKAKLDGIAENANNYTHPLSHDANMITESSEKRFVSDTEKSSWNSKQSELISGENIKTINNVSILGGGNIEVSGSPTGTIIVFGASTAPTGYLKCNGALISRTTYAALFAAIGTTFGVGDGSTTFKLPDLRAEFIRGWDDGRGVDTARVFGSAQADTFKDHQHIQTSGYSSPFGNSSTSPLSYTATHNDGVQYSTANQLVSNVETAGMAGYGTETRPRNIAMLYCIKY